MVLRRIMVVCLFVTQHMNHQHRACSITSHVLVLSTLLQNFLSWCCFHGFSLRHFFKNDCAEKQALRNLDLISRGISSVFQTKLRSPVSLIALDALCSASTPLNDLKLTIVPSHASFLLKRAVPPLQLTLILCASGNVLCSSSRSIVCFLAITLPVVPIMLAFDMIFSFPPVFHSFNLSLDSACSVSVSDLFNHVLHSSSCYDCCMAH